MLIGILQSLYYQANAAKVKATNNRWRSANPDKVKVNNGRAAKKWWDSLSIAEKKAIHESRREKTKRWNAAWHAAHPERAREKAQKRRALERNQFVENVEVAVLVERDRGRCGICGLHVAKEDWSIDHILPLSLGGVLSYANTRLTHRRCNSGRSNRGAAQLRLVG